jgi:MoaA/NifB/PqqE/SkfB family radical SAM enzyme
VGLYNRAAFMLSLLKNKLTGGRVPLVAVLNITARCNLRCTYCYGQYFQNPAQDYTTEELFHLIEELARLGTRSITLGGGEPLIRDDIGRLINKIKAHGIECGFNTNGLLIEKRINELSSADMICVSLDGPQKENDLNRGASSFAKIVAGIEKALQAGITVHTTTVFTRHNCTPAVVDWIIDFALKNNIQAEFNFLFHQKDDKNNPDLFPHPEHLRQVALHIAHRKSEGAPVLFSEQAYLNVANWPLFPQQLHWGGRPSFSYIPCYAGRFMMFIDVDGKVYPCVQLIDLFKALDWRQVGLKKAWDHCATHSCHACYFPCFNEFNLIMGFRPKILWQQIMSSLKGH